VPPLTACKTEMSSLPEAQRLHLVSLQRLQVRSRSRWFRCAHCCHGASNELTGVPVTHTHNIFTSFAYGISKGPFPFTISIRHEDESFIVFDDLLALSRSGRLPCAPVYSCIGQVPSQRDSYFVLRGRLDWVACEPQGKADTNRLSAVDVVDLAGRCGADRSHVRAVLVRFVSCLVVSRLR
jgi:hypothetical protein